jgi:hypothetical protein
LGQKDTDPQEEVQGQNAAQAGKKQGSNAINFIQTNQTVSIIGNPLDPADIGLIEENRQLKQELPSFKGAKHKPASSDRLAQSEFAANQIAASAQEILLESTSTNLARSLQTAVQRGVDISVLSSQFKAKLLSKIGALFRLLQCWQFNSGGISSASF